MEKKPLVMTLVENPLHPCQIAYFTTTSKPLLFSLFLKCPPHTSNKFFLFSGRCHMHLFLTSILELPVLI